MHTPYHVGVTTPLGFDNGGDFAMNYLNQGNGGNLNIDPNGLNPLMADYNQLGALGKMGVWSTGLGAASNLFQLYAGFKALDFQKDQFRFAKDAWTKNYNNQLKDYENTLKDRWAARSASAAARGGSYASMGDWVGGRMPDGTAPSGNYAGARAASPQAFYGATSVQENRKLPLVGSR